MYFIKTLQNCHFAPFFKNYTESTVFCNIWTKVEAALYSGVVELPPVIGLAVNMGLSCEKYCSCNYLQLITSLRHVAWLFGNKILLNKAR